MQQRRITIITLFLELNRAPPDARSQLNQIPRPRIDTSADITFAKSLPKDDKG